jgi:tetratricopeptide (TPR) repeat protein
MVSKSCITILSFMVILSLHGSCLGQNLSPGVLRQNLDALDKDPALPASGKLAALVELKRRSDLAKLYHDSVYAKLLHKIGLLQFQVNRNYFAAISLTLEALRINTSGKRDASAQAAVGDAYNTAYYYDRLNLFRKAVLYYDVAIRYSSYGPDIGHAVLDSRLKKAYIYFRMGDYEKAVEESDLGIAVAEKKRDSSQYLFLLNQRAQSQYFQNNLQAALADAKMAVSLARQLRNDFDLASAYKTEGFVYQNQRKFELAISFFRQCISERVKTRDFGQVADDYNDLGNFYGDSLLEFGKSRACFITAIQYAKKTGDSIRMARLSVNLGRSYYFQQQFVKAINYYTEAMRLLRIARGPDLRGNPLAAELEPIGNEELILVLFNSKTRTLLGLYKKTHDRKWLDDCLSTALLNDTLIVAIRHEQMGEQSKLYWRDRTRGFFNDALEACYFAGDDKLAFYFMEKSRSVLLQDKLNETVANDLLPPLETAKQDSLQMHVVEIQQRLADLSDTSASYRSLRIKFLEAKEDLEQFTASLETRYPYYYQYKYAERVPSLIALQEFLGRKNQHFIEYFIEDTVNFALVVTATTTRLIRIKNQQIGPVSQHLGNMLSLFIQSCSDEEGLNRAFGRFLTRANLLYRMLFEPCGFLGGKVIICQDNYLLPFEALSKDPIKPDFLVRNYAFSYVYSARYLMNAVENLAGKGDFLGIAPVGFGAYRGLPDLRRSEEALRACAGHYRESKLLLTEDASRSHFLQEVADYTVTTVLTHARADSSGDEPLLFMKDSVIHLSELQVLNKPATRLIILSACQTNAGRNRSGEGIFSLARGFSAAGIPSVAATQWEADEQAIYSISEKFNEFISQGSDKDEALQQAKLYYMFQDKSGSILPCYWADMILIGNTDPIRFSERAEISRRKTGLTRRLAIAGVLAIGLIVFGGILFLMRTKT